MFIKINSEKVPNVNILISYIVFMSPIYTDKEYHGEDLATSHNHIYNGTYRIKVRSQTGDNLGGFEIRFFYRNATLFRTANRVFIIRCRLNDQFVEHRIEYPKSASEILKVSLNPDGTLQINGHDKQLFFTADSFYPYAVDFFAESIPDGSVIITQNGKTYNSGDQFTKGTYFVEIKSRGVHVGSFEFTDIGNSELPWRGIEIGNDLKKVTWLHDGSKKIAIAINGDGSFDLDGLSYRNYYTHSLPCLIDIDSSAITDAKVIITKDNETYNPGTSFNDGTYYVNIYSKSGDDLGGFQFTIVGYSRLGTRGLNIGNHLKKITWNYTDFGRLTIKLEKGRILLNDDDKGLSYTDSGSPDVGASHAPSYMSKIIGMSLETFQLTYDLQAGEEDYLSAVDSLARRFARSEFLQNRAFQVYTEKSVVSAEIIASQVKAEDPNAEDANRVQLRSLLELDYARTEHGDSIFGPGAYFHDLMRIALMYIKVNGDPRDCFRYMLTTRRPDLLDIPIDSDHAVNILVPTLSLVNYILSTHIVRTMPIIRRKELQAIQNPPTDYREKMEYYERHAFRALLAADEELSVVDTEILNYKLMKPPFDLTYEKQTAYLEASNTSLYQVKSMLSDFNGTGDEVAGGGRKDEESSLACQYLNINKTEVQWLNSVQSDDSEFSATVNTRDFCKKSQISYEELGKLLRLDVTNNPIRNLLPNEGFYFINRFSSGSGVTNLSLTLKRPEQAENISHLSNSRLYRIGVFLFLANRIGWDYDELELVLSVLNIKGPGINLDALGRISCFKQIQDKFKLSVVELVSLLVNGVVPYSDRSLPKRILNQIVDSPVNEKELSEEMELLPIYFLVLEHHEMKTDSVAVVPVSTDNVASGVGKSEEIAILDKVLSALTKKKDDGLASLILDDLINVLSIKEKDITERINYFSYYAVRALAHTCRLTGVTPQEVIWLLNSGNLLKHLWNQEPVSASPIIKFLYSLGRLKEMFSMDLVDFCKLFSLSRQSTSSSEAINDTVVNAISLFLSQNPQGLMDQLVKLSDINDKRIEQEWDLDKLAYVQLGIADRVYDSEVSSIVRKIQGEPNFRVYKKMPFGSWIANLNNASFVVAINSKLADFFGVNESVLDRLLLSSSVGIDPVLDGSFNKMALKNRFYTILIRDDVSLAENNEKDGATYATTIIHRCIVLLKHFDLEDSPSYENRKERMDAVLEQLVSIDDEFESIPLCTEIFDHTTAMLKLGSEIENSGVSGNNKVIDLDFKKKLSDDLVRLGKNEPSLFDNEFRISDSDRTLFNDEIMSAQLMLVSFMGVYEQQIISPFASQIEVTKAWLKSISSLYQKILDKQVKIVHSIGFMLNEFNAVKTKLVDNIQKAVASDKDERNTKEIMISSEERVAAIQMDLQFMEQKMQEVKDEINLAKNNLANAQEKDRVYLGILSESKVEEFSACRDQLILFRSKTSLITDTRLGRFFNNTSKSYGPFSHILLNMQEKITDLLESAYFSELNQVQKDTVYKINKKIAEVKFTSHYYKADILLHVMNLCIKKTINGANRLIYVLNAIVFYTKKYRSKVPFNLDDVDMDAGTVVVNKFLSEQISSLIEGIHQEDEKILLDKIIKSLQNKLEPILSQIFSQAEMVLSDQSSLTRGLALEFYDELKNLISLSALFVEIKKSFSAFIGYNRQVRLILKLKGNLSASENDAIDESTQKFIELKDFIKQQLNLTSHRLKQVTDTDDSVKAEGVLNEYLAKIPVVLRNAQLFCFNDHLDSDFQQKARGNEFSLSNVSVDGVNLSIDNRVNVLERIDNQVKTLEQLVQEKNIVKDNSRELLTKLKAKPTYFLVTAPRLHTYLTQVKRCHLSFENLSSLFDPDSKEEVENKSLIADYWIDALSQEKQSLLSLVDGWVSEINEIFKGVTSESNQLPLVSVFPAVDMDDMLNTLYTDIEGEMDDMFVNGAASVTQEIYSEIVLSRVTSAVNNVIGRALLPVGWSQPPRFATEKFFSVVEKLVLLCVVTHNAFLALREFKECFDLINDRDAFNEIGNPLGSIQYSIVSIETMGTKIREALEDTFEFINGCKKVAELGCEISIQNKIMQRQQSLLEDNSNPEEFISYKHRSLSKDLASAVKKLLLLEQEYAEIFNQANSDLTAINIGDNNLSLSDNLLDKKAHKLASEKIITHARNELENLVTRCNVLRIKALKELESFKNRGELLQSLTQSSSEILKIKHSEISGLDLFVQLFSDLVEGYDGVKDLQLKINFISFGLTDAEIFKLGLSKKDVNAAENYFSSEFNSFIDSLKSMVGFKMDADNLEPEELDLKAKTGAFAFRTYKKMRSNLTLLSTMSPYINNVIKKLSDLHAASLVPASNSQSLTLALTSAKEFVGGQFERLLAPEYKELTGVGLGIGIASFQVAIESFFKSLSENLDRSAVSSSFNECMGVGKNISEYIGKYMGESVLKYNKHMSTIVSSGSLHWAARELLRIEYVFTKLYPFEASVFKKKLTGLGYDDYLSAEKTFNYSNMNAVNEVLMNSKDELNNDLFKKIGVLSAVQIPHSLISNIANFKRHERMLADDKKYLLSALLSPDIFSSDYVNYLIINMLNISPPAWSELSSKLMPMSVDSLATVEISVSDAINYIDLLFVLRDLLSQFSGDSKLVLSFFSSSAQIDFRVQHLAEVAKLSNKKSYDIAVRKVAEKKRDVLVHKILWNHQHNDPKGDLFVLPSIDTPSKLSQYLLTDVMISGEDTITPIVYAHTTVQWYLRRCRHGVESIEYPVQVENQISDKWAKWISNYRVWEANRKVFLYPENYLAPELRVLQSDFFREMVKQLKKPQLSDSMIASAYLSYLSKLSEMQNLKAVSLDARVLDSATKTSRIYILAYTQTEPADYYFRAVDQMGADREFNNWTFWKKIPLAIPARKVGDPLHKTQMFFVHNRLYLYWFTMVGIDTLGVNVGDDLTSAEEDNSMSYKLHWSYQLDDGSWKVPQSRTSTVKEKDIGSWIPDYKNRDEFRSAINLDGTWSDDLKTFSTAKKLAHHISNWAGELVSLPGGLGEKIQFPQGMTSSIAKAQETLNSSDSITDIFSQVDETSAEPSTYHQFDDPWGGYYWELFYFAPLFLANQLQETSQFEEAQDWYHAVFNPARLSKNLPAFVFAPLANKLGNDVLMPLMNQLYLRELRNHAFRAHSIARLRGEIPYQKYTVMAYIRNAISWGDYLFNQNTRESVAEANGYYLSISDLLGGAPRGLYTATYENKDDSQTLHELFQAHRHYNDQSEGDGTSPAQAMTVYPYNYTTASYFTVPENREFMALWDDVADRLYKIRHCLSLQGLRQQLALFSPVIDPHQLVRAVAARGGEFVQDMLNELSTQHRPHYRFVTLLSHAKEMASFVDRIGNALHTALEREDATALESITNQYSQEVFDTITKSKKLEIAVAEKNKSLLAVRKASLNERLGYYNQQLERGGLLEEETIADGLEAAALAVNMSECVLSTAAEIAGTVPTIGSIVALVWGGKEIRHSIRATAGVLRNLSMGLQYGAGLENTRAVRKRRNREWKLQKSLLEKELDGIPLEEEIADLRFQLAEEGKRQHDVAVRHQKETGDYYRRKFTNLDLCKWMSGQLLQLHNQAYLLAVKAAKKAANAFKYERGTAVNSQQLDFGLTLKKACFLE